MVPLPTRARHEPAHFCCYLSQTVRVTLKFSRRNSRSRKKMQNKNTMVLTHFSSAVTPGPLETHLHKGASQRPPQRPRQRPPRVPQSPPESPRDFPWRFPEPPRDLDGRKCPKIDENWFEWGRHESPRAHIRRGRSYGLSDASGTLPDPFSARFRSI